MAARVPKPSGAEAGDAGPVLPATYGISADDADAILEAQGGGCAICGRCPDRLASLHLDHDHSTGAIRGFLCIDCNQGLGKLRDDPELLRRAADYVEQHRRP